MLLVPDRKHLLVDAAYDAGATVNEARENLDSGRACLNCSQSVLAAEYATAGVDHHFTTDLRPDVGDHLEHVGENRPAAEAACPHC